MDISGYRYKTARQVLAALLLAGGLSHLSAQTAAAVQNEQDSLRQRIVDIARQYLGVPYVYGAMSPSAFDCSGFVRWVFQQAAGLSVPRSSRDYISAGNRISLRTAQPGDVLVYDTVGGRPSHVGIFIGNGQFIHAASAGTRTGVIISQVTERYWSPKLIDVRNFLPAAAGSAAVARAPAAAAPVEPPAPATAAPATPSATSAPSLPAAPEPASAVASAPAATVAPATTAAPIAAVPPVSASSTPAASHQPERVIAEIGFEIPERRTSYHDPIPTEKNTELAFTVTNASGRDGRFVVIFYRLDARLNPQEIHQELVELKQGAAYSLPPFRFEEAGRYRLIVKDNWNSQLLERSFTVRD